jgi:hypothetical protein
MKNTLKLAVLLVIALIAVLGCTKKGETVTQTSSESGTAAVQTETENKSATTQTSAEFQMDSTTSDLPKVMYINSTNGLRGRAEPTTNSTVVRTLLYGQRIVINERRSTSVTIDGLTDYWYKTYYWDEAKTWYFGDDMWLFGGYVTELFPSDAPALLGKWHRRDRVGSCEGIGHFNFYADGSYRRDGNSGFLEIGKWSLDGNVLTLQYKEPIEDSMEFGTDEKTDHVDLTIENFNNINLIFQDGNKYELVRCSDPSSKN